MVEEALSWVHIKDRICGARSGADVRAWRLVTCPRCVQAKVNQLWGDYLKTYSHGFRDAVVRFGTMPTIPGGTPRA